MGRWSGNDFEKRRLGFGAEAIKNLSSLDKHVFSHHLDLVLVVSSTVFGCVFIH